MPSDENADGDHRAVASASLGAFVTGGLAYILLTSSLVAKRQLSSTPIWNTDFGIFYQAGRHVATGNFDQLYRYVPPGADPASYPDVWLPFLTHVDGYFYGQAPWQAFVVAPLTALDLDVAFAIYGGVMIALPLVAAIALRRVTSHGWVWGLALLFAPLVVPFVAPTGWGSTDYAFHWIGLGPLRWESALGATLWWGQYTPALLALLTLAFVAAHRRRHVVAGFLLVLATMKPNVLFVVPLVLLVTDDWRRLIAHTAAWAIGFNLVFMVIPGLGYPMVFVENVTSYSEVFWPIVLQTHNYVWMIGAAVVTVALRIGGDEPMPSLDVDGLREAIS